MKDWRAKLVHRSRSRGAAMLETALILPLFLIFWFGIADWGIAFWIHETVVHKANAAVRWQATNTLCPGIDQSLCTDAAKDDTAIKKMFLYGNPAATGSTSPSSLWFSLTPPTIDVHIEGAETTFDRRIVMTVSNYQWMHFTPFFASRYLGRPVTVSLPVEDLKNGL